MTMTTEQAAFQDVRADASPLEDGRYLLKVVRLEPSDDGQFGPSIRWVFNVADPATKAIIRDSQGEFYEWHQYSSTKLTPRSKAYPWIVALLGREVQVGESGGAIARELIGKRAVAMVGPKEAGGRAVILSIKPFTSAPAATPEPAPAPPADDGEEF